jgi:multiple sugar transport system substrate-binding protein
MGGNLLIFLNRKAFQKASEFHGKPVEPPGSDWTIAQFLRTAEKLTCDFDRDGQTDQYGFALPGWDYYLPFIWSFGADLTDPQATRWTFSGPTAMAVMRFYRQLATGDRVVPNASELPEGTAEGAFLSGKAAMCINGTRFVPELDRSERAGDYLVAPIPRGPGGRVTAVLWDAVVVRTGLTDLERERAFRLAAWLLSPQVQRRMAHAGLALPAILEARPIFVEPDPLRRKPFVDALSYSRLPDPMPGFEAIDRVMTQHFGEAVDPTLKFEAVTVLEALASDPAILTAFSSDGSR